MRDEDPLLGNYYDFESGPLRSNSTSKSSALNATAGLEAIIDEQNTAINSEPISTLWVLEPSDLDDFSLADLELIWKDCEQLCGSFEAAAEVFALMNVAQGDDEHYRGWQAYVDHPALKDLRDSLPSLTGLDQLDDPYEPDKDVKTTEAYPVVHDDQPIDPVRAESNKVKSVINPLANHRVEDNQENQPSEHVMPKRMLEEVDPTPKQAIDFSNLDLDQIQALWQNRYTAFRTVSEACMALSLVRYHSGIDKNPRHWESFKGSDLILPLLDSLEDDTLSEVPSEASDLVVDELTSDRRVIKNQLVKVRAYQSDFRERVLQHFKECCVTGCTESSVLEAAHIMPYMGDHSNLIDNGLLLRVDAHRLFDKFLLSIDPNTTQIEIASCVTDSFYLGLNGKRLDVAFSRLTKQFLGRHYATFKKIHGEAHAASHN